MEAVFDNILTKFYSPSLGNAGSETVYHTWHGGCLWYLCTHTLPVTISAISTVAEYQNLYVNICSG